jgi:hypothetical protein
MLVGLAGVFVVDVATARCGLDDGSFMACEWLREANYLISVAAQKQLV